MVLYSTCKKGAVARAYAAPKHTTRNNKSMPMQLGAKKPDQRPNTNIISVTIHVENKLFKLDVEWIARWVRRL